MHFDTIDWSIMATGPTWEDRYMNDREFANRWDRVMDEANEDLAKSLKTPKDKVLFYGTFAPVMLFALVALIVTAPFRVISNWFQRRKHRK